MTLCPGAVRTKLFFQLHKKVIVQKYMYTISTEISLNNSYYLVHSSVLTRCKEDEENIELNEIFSLH
jgi:hypothetical protein